MKVTMKQSALQKIKKIFLPGMLLTAMVVLFSACTTSVGEKMADENKSLQIELTSIDTTKIPNDKFGEAVRYGRQLLLNTAYYIGPEGTRGSYLGNKMNCTNCHQDAGTKAYSFNLMTSHDSYPQYRGREGKVLTLAERVNNCVMRPHNGKPLPLEGPEMVAMLSYLKWINTFVSEGQPFTGSKNKEIQFPERAADPERGKELFQMHCARCHGASGEGQWKTDSTGYIYPPLWGEYAYQPGSSMHRIIKQAQWLKHNMPYDKVANGPYLTDEEALDIAAFVNDDTHERPTPESFDYPRAIEKPIDYDKPPFIDNFSARDHKFGPYQPIIDYWKKKGWKAIY